MERRSFLKTSALVSASLMVPEFVKASTKSFLREQSKGRRLIVIQLSGGNDGLNTLVPFRNDDYYNLRPQIGLQKGELHLISDDLGLNPGLLSLKELFDKGWVTLLNGVGYPNPNRSHFRSTDIWNSGTGSDEFVNTGWIGRYLDNECTGFLPHNAVDLDNGLTLALKGEKNSGLSVSDPQKLAEAVRHPYVAMNSGQSHDNDHPQLAYLNKTLVDVVSSAEYVEDHMRVQKTREEYPYTTIGQKMKTIGQLINSGSQTQIFYASLSGFDTHANQQGTHERLLGNWADAVQALLNDLDQTGNLEDTLVMTFSEFGRRAKQNAAKGTDHGTANNLFLMGGSLANPGVYNEIPSLSDLDSGDLKYSIDFRDIYASILSDWFQADHSKILSGKRKLLTLV